VEEEERLTVGRFRAVHIEVIDDEVTPEEQLIALLGTTARRDQGCITSANIWLNGEYWAEPAGGPSQLVSGDHPNEHTCILVVASHQVERISANLKTRKVPDALFALGVSCGHYPLRLNLEINLPNQEGMNE